MDAAICIFADDTTRFAADSCLNKVLERLETDALVLSKWFPEHFMKLNEGKHHLLTFGTIQSNIKIEIREATVEESCAEKLLGLILDEKLNFKIHISSFERELVINARNLQYLMTEIYKTKNSRNPCFMRELLKL